MYSMSACLVMLRDSLLYLFPPSGSREVFEKVAEMPLVDCRGWDGFLSGGDNSF